MLGVQIVQYIGMYTNLVSKKLGTMEPQWIAACVATVRRQAEPLDVHFLQQQRVKLN